MAGPGHLGNGRSVRRTAHPRRVGLEDAHHHSEVEASPTLATLAVVIARCADPASSAATLGHLARAHVRDGSVRLLVDPQPTRSPSPCRHRASDAIRWHRATPFSSPRLRILRQVENLGRRRRCSLFSSSGRPRIRQESRLKKGHVPERTEQLPMTDRPDAGRPRGSNNEPLTGPGPREVLAKLRRGAGPCGLHIVRREIKQSVVGRPWRTGHAVPV
jgi:hypothetical protein